MNRHRVFILAAATLSATLWAYACGDGTTDSPAPHAALAHVAEIAAKAGPIPAQVDEGPLGTSANATIPAAVVQPGLEMVVEVDPDGTPDPGLGVKRRTPEAWRR